MVCVHNGTVPTVKNQVNVICGMGGTRDCHRKQIQLGLGRQCLFSYMVPGSHTDTYIIFIYMIRNRSEAVWEDKGLMGDRKMKEE